jgi:hypothetical protein
MVTQDVYLLTLHEPYEAPLHPVPINATLVHALTLLHPAVPQPDGGRIYRCLTEFPGRTPGCIVPLSTLTFELNRGQLWPEVGDWEGVSETVAHLARNRDCDAMPMGLPETSVALLANGPTTRVTVYHPDGRQSSVGAAERQQLLVELTQRLRTYVEQGAFWPGDNLVAPPAWTLPTPAEGRPRDLNRPRWWRQLRRLFLRR